MTQKRAAGLFPPNVVSASATAAVPSRNQRFHDLLAYVGELHDRKQADYGRTGDPFANVKASAEFGISPWIGCMIRANDKMRRLQKFAISGVLQNETVYDSFLDLAVYALIAYLLYEEDESTYVKQVKTAGEPRSFDRSTAASSP